MKNLKSCFNKRINGYAKKTVIYLLIAAVLLPYFCVQQIHAAPGDLWVEKTVYRDIYIAGGGAPDYVLINEGDTTVEHTNVLKYRNEIFNDGANAETVNITVNMPENCILFFSDEWYGLNDDGRMVYGMSPTYGYISAGYTDVSYAWMFDTGTNEYHRSVAAATQSGVSAYALEGPHSLSPAGAVTIPAGGSAVFEYAVIVWTDGLTGYEILDDFRIDGVQKDPFELYFFDPQQSMTADASDTVAVGEDVTYTLYMQSVGTSAEMELEIPVGTTYKNATLSIGGATSTTPVFGTDSISFTLTDIPLDTEFTVSYTVTVDAGAAAVNNTQTMVNNVAFDPIYLNVTSGGTVVASGYAADILPSQGIVAGQLITYTASVYSMAGSPENTVISVPIPSGAEFVSADGDYDSVDVVDGQIDFAITALGATPLELEFTLKLKEKASGDLAVHFSGMGTPWEWRHPILVVTKSLEKDTIIAGDTANTSLPGYSAISDGSAVDYKDLIKFVYSVKNTGTISVSGMNLSAPTPNDMALYITFKSALSAIGVADYGTTTQLTSANAYPLLNYYADLAYVWETRPETATFTDYQRSIEAEENALDVPGGYYGRFTVYKDNLSLTPNEECDFRYAAFVNSDVIATEFGDEFSVNGVLTKPVRLLIPAFGITSDPAPFSSVALDGLITYTFTMPIRAATVFEADIPTGTRLVAGSATTVTSAGEPVTIVATPDKITFTIPAGTALGMTSVSYTVVAERPVKIMINNVNVNGVYLGTISHNMTSVIIPEDIILGYTFTSHLNSNYIGYGDRMTFKFYVYNNTDSPQENVVVTAPIDESLRLDPSSVPYWFDDHAVIIDKDGVRHNPNDLRIAFSLPGQYNPLEFDYSAYDALGPFSVQWTIPYIDARQAVSVLVNQLGEASEISFAGNIKPEDDIPRETATVEQNASLTADGGREAFADTYVYYFPPRTFVSLGSDLLPSNINSPSGELLFQNGPQYKRSDIITYTVSVNQAEITLGGMAELFVSSTIPAGASFVSGSVKAFKDGVLLSALDADIDLNNPGKIRIRIPDPEQENYSVSYSVEIKSYKGKLKTYAIGQVLQDQLSPENVMTRTVVAASETDIWQHDFDTPRSTVTINRQRLVNSSGAELNTILQSVGGELVAQQVDFIITFTDSSGNEYNVVMKNGETNLVFYGLPYNELITITETGTSDTVFKEVTDSIGGDSGVTLAGGSYSFTLSDTDMNRNISFTIVSEHRPNGGFSSAASRNNPFEVPNLDFTSLLKYQLQDLASTQLDNGPGDGAIPIADDALSYNFATQRFSIRPYFSMTVANAFLLDPAYYDNARRYIQWHIDHLNTHPDGDVYGMHGSIYDYYYSLVGGEQRAFTMAESDNTVDVYDSTDSYAALFFELLLKYYETTEEDPLGVDSLIESSMLDLIRLCLEESFSTSPALTPPPGGGDLRLTVAKPNYPMEFLMDNCEVYRGFLCLEELYTMIGHHADATIAADYAESIWLGIETHLYNSTNENYDYALLNPSDTEAYYYPDAIAQMFPIIFDVVDPDSLVAKKLYGEFIENFPYWTDMTNLDRVGQTPKINRGGGDSVFPSVLLAKAAVKMGDLKGVALSFKNIETLYRQNANAFPFLCYESGETALCIFEFMNAYYEMCGEVFTAVPTFQGGYGY